MFATSAAIASILHRTNHLNERTVTNKVTREPRTFHFALAGAQSVGAANRAAAQENEMASLSFARIMYGTNEDLHAHESGNSTSRPFSGARASGSIGIPSGNSSQPFSVRKLLYFARLFLDGKAE
jgi:hypothetical protein